jgi:NADH dehydrogenase/NADH:ubiquinone oxidoreductase subunit G
MKGLRMTELISLTIDGQAVSVPPGVTILEAARQAGIPIPTICYHDYCTANGLCRICVVEVEGARTLVASCVTQAAPGMQIHTSTDRVRRARRTVLEMLSASVDLSEAPDIKQLMREYEVNYDRFPGAVRRAPPVIDDNPMFIRDYAKCILCWRCVQVCGEDVQYTFALNFRQRGYRTQIATFYNHPLPETTCVFCGQCVGVCPTGALKPKREWLMEQGYTPDEIMGLTRTERRRRGRTPAPNPTEDGNERQP